MSNLVEIKGITKSYSAVPVLRSVSLVVRKGEHLALLGPSGCGKTTLLRILAGLDAPCTGEVWLSGMLSSTGGKILLPPHQRSLSMVFQDLALWPNLKTMDNVALGLSGMKLSREERARRARKALEACGVDDLANRKPASLSGGQQQRVALARALAVRPQLLLLDEPFSGLDLPIKARLCSEIRRLSEEFELTVALVSHDPLEALALCSHAAVLEDGVVSEQGLLHQLLANPQSETLQAFVEQLPGRVGQAPS